MTRKLSVKQHELKIYWGKTDGVYDLCCTYDPDIEKKAKGLLKRIINEFGDENFFDITTLKLSISKREIGYPKVKFNYVF